MKPKKSVHVLAAAVSTENDDCFIKLLEKFNFRKVLRILRLKKNYSNSMGCRKKGPLRRSEVKKSEVWCIKRTQNDAKENPEFEGNCLELNVQLHGDGVLECRGRIAGGYPVFLL